MKEKQRLRQQFSQARRTLAKSLWQANSQRLCHHLCQWPQFQQAQTVLAYFSIRQEPDLTSLFALPKVWGFPRCQGLHLTWHRWQPGEPLQQGAYGILEPLAEADLILPSTVDLLLIPALAVDDRGYRLGYGGGYYDRLLAQPDWHKIRTLGVLFASARVPHLPTDPWDIPLTVLVTEEGIVMGDNN
ncbi:5-formyltetrahydrofolate cyclo-ligase [Synechocystis sp. LKSZ1]|uniref:5-formyltetrahydrofolate cyclo-ligase n=1 Tax=Synechocystis sp. LKSZ1 TaxID=3144951 RepID=UPI00336C2E27